MKYIAIAAVTLGVGAEVGLNKEQAAARRHCTAASTERKGWFNVTAPLQFKAGESFFYDGDLPKGMANEVEPAKKSSTKAEQEAAAKAAMALDVARTRLAEAEKAVAVVQSDEAADKAAVELADARKALAALQG